MTYVRSVTYSRRVKAASPFPEFHRPLERCSCVFPDPNFQRGFMLRKSDDRADFLEDALRRIMADWLRSLDLRTSGTKFLSG